jgi:hypothetical protein
MTGQVQDTNWATSHALSSSPAGERVTERAPEYPQQLRKRSDPRIVHCLELDARSRERLTVELEPNAICLWLLEVREVYCGKRVVVDGCGKMGHNQATMSQDA